MTESVVFSEVVQSIEELRAIIGSPRQLVIDKVIHEVDDYCREFIARSPFLLIGTSDAQGNADVSPKGGEPGFVQVLDDHTLLIPDRPGNRRADSLTNILQNPRIGMLFLVPGKGETLRVNGRAQLVRDAHLRERFTVKGQVPQILIAVTVADVYFHCAKCIIRSKLWEAGAAQAELTSLAQVLIKHAHLSDNPETFQQEIDEEYQHTLS